MINKLIELLKNTIKTVLTSNQIDNITNNLPIVKFKRLRRRYVNQFKRNIKPGQLIKKKTHPVKLLKRAQPCDVNKLKEEYNTKKLYQVPDNFVLYRIIGNDLFPRHKKGQSRINLQFILENEPELEKCIKIFIVNRIINKDEEQAIINLLDQSNYNYIHIPFNLDEYNSIGFDTNCFPEWGYLVSEEFEELEPEKKTRAVTAAYRLKNNYVMNNNGARNIALRDGKKKAKWVLPWDGNCFITRFAWEQIKSDVMSAPYLKYFVVPMARIFSNENMLREDFVPDPVEEPQLIFRKDSNEEFNEEFCYGRRPKVELFWRLGIPGKWEYWLDQPWDQKRTPISKEARQFGTAGWVARLFSGMGSLEQKGKKSFSKRGLVRMNSIINTLQHLDAEISGISAEDYTIFHNMVLEKERRGYLLNDNLELVKIINQLIIDAEEALTRGPYSVIDKNTLPPSGDINDYWHPAPYMWPNPKKRNGLPYIRRDGKRVPGTRLYEPGSEKYDRTRLQRVFDDSTILALAWKFSGKAKYAEQGAKILEQFFVNPKTRMNPHLKYAQVRMGRNNNRGDGTGIIEMKDLYYYLDAVRLLNSAGVITENNLEAFKEWLSCYLEWLIKSSQGKNERIATNNHGIYYDLQVASIASFLNKIDILYETLIRAQARIPKHFSPDGQLPNELLRTNTAHYCCFNLQGWLNIAKLAFRWNVDLWSYKAPNGSSLKKSADWILSHMGQKWPYQQIEKFDHDRFLAIYFAIPDRIDLYNYNIELPSSRYEVKPKFYPHDGILPYWNIGLSSR